MAHTTLGNTLASGVQDVSAFLPLLGTDQCETHIGDALDGGYLYAAATPLSMFGCLGIVQASVSVLLASLSSGTARMLRDAGFSLQGSAASMIERSKGIPVSFTVETRFRELRKQYCLNEDVELKLDQSFKWNTLLLITTFVLSLLSIAPYIPIIISDRNSSHVTVWLYPVLRIIGSAACVVAAQIAIQCRIIVILRNSKQVPDGVSPISDPEKAKYSSHQPARKRKRENEPLYLALSQLFLLLGIIATGVGYVGCFTLVQNTKPLNAILWLSLEAALSFLRVLLWAWNPQFDEDAAVTVTMELAKSLPEIPTQSSENDIRQGREPFLVVDDRSFLEQVVPYTGPMERFTDPERQLAISYTLFAGPSPSDLLASKSLLTTVFNRETGDCFVLETAKSTESHTSGVTQKLLTYPAKRESTGAIRVQHSDDPEALSQPPCLEEIRRHSQTLIDRICGMDRSNSLNVQWSFRSSTLRASALSDTLEENLEDFWQDKAELLELLRTTRQTQGVFLTRLPSALRRSSSSLEIPRR